MLGRALVWSRPLTPMFHMEMLYFERCSLPEAWGSEVLHMHPTSQSFPLLICIYGLYYCSYFFV